MIESSRKTLITIPAGNCLVNSVQPTGQILYAGYEKDMTACLTLANITGKDLDGTGESSARVHPNGNHNTSSSYLPVEATFQDTLIKGVSPSGAIPATAWTFETRFSLH